MLYRSYKNYLKKISYPKSNASGFVDVVPPVEVVFPFLNFQPKFELFTSKNVLKPDSSHSSESDVCSYGYQDFREIHNNSYDFPNSSVNEWIWLGEDGYEFESMPPLEPIPGVFLPNSFDSAKITERGLIHPSFNSCIERGTEKWNSEKKVLFDKPVHQPELTFENDPSSKRKRPECIFRSDKRGCIVSNGETKEKFSQVSISTCSSVGPKDPKSGKINSKVNGNLPSKSLHSNVSASNSTFPEDLSESSPIDCISFNNASDLQAFASAMLNKKSRIVRESKEKSPLCNAWKSKEEFLLCNAREIKGESSLCNMRETKGGLFSWDSGYQQADLTSSMRKAKKCNVSQTKGESSSCIVRETNEGLSSWDSEPANQTSSMRQVKKCNVSQTKGELFLCKMRETEERLPSWEWRRSGYQQADLTSSMQQAQKTNKPLKSETLIENQQGVRKKPYSVITPESFPPDSEKIPFVALDLDSSDEEEIKYDSSEILLEDSLKHEVIDGKECDPIISKPPQVDRKPSIRQALKKCKSFASKIPTGNNRQKSKRSRRTPKPTIFRNCVPEKITFTASDLDSPDEKEIKYDWSETIPEISLKTKVIDKKGCDSVTFTPPQSDPKPSMCQALKTNKSIETETLIEDNRQKPKSDSRPVTTSKPITLRNFDPWEKIPFVDSDLDSLEEDYDSSETVSEYSFLSKSEVMKRKEKDQQVDSEPRRSLRIHLRGYKESEMGGTCNEMYEEPVKGGLKTE